MGSILLTSSASTVSLKFLCQVFSKIEKIFTSNEVQLRLWPKITSSKTYFRIFQMQQETDIKQSDTCDDNLLIQHVFQTET